MKENKLPKIPGADLVKVLYNKFFANEINKRNVREEKIKGERDYYKEKVERLESQFNFFNESQGVMERGYTLLGFKLIESNRKFFTIDRKFLETEKRYLYFTYKNLGETNFYEKSIEDLEALAQVNSSVA